MSNYRRSHLPGGCYFFTINLLERHQNHLLVEQIDLLRNAVRQVRNAHPFHIDAWVVLPEHMHCIWTPPQNDADYSTRIRLIKSAFSRNLPPREYRSITRQARRERGIWQRRFWEHTIRDDQDYERHIDYLHYNPVKHGHVSRVRDWPYSSFWKYAQQGVYPEDWGYDGSELSVGEPG